MFDQICLLAEGQTAYFGPVNKLEEYLSNIGHPLPLHINPAEFLLDLVNADFGSSGSMSLSAVLEGWERSSARRVHLSNVNHHRRPMPRSLYDAGRMSERLGSRSLLVLLYRSFIKSYRDVVVYGVRLAMYFGLAVMMGTVWLRLDSHQDSIQPFINALVSHVRLNG